MKPNERIVAASKFRDKPVTVVDKWGHVVEGTVVAVGTSLGGTSWDWIAVRTPDHSFDTFISLAAVDAIEIR